MPADKPAVNLNLDALEREDAPEPFAFVLGGERFVCADPMELDYRAFRDMGDPEGQFKLLLGAKFESFKAHKLVLWKQQRLVSTALEHYGLGGYSRLAWLLERYGKAVEADLGLRGWDLADLWRRRRFRFLLNLVDHLPRNSAYGDALAQDDELAVEAAERPDDTGPSLAEWSPEVALLSDLVDVLLLLRSEVWKLAGQKTAPPYRPVPRPLTAADRLAAERRERVRDDLRRLLPEG